MPRRQPKRVLESMLWRRLQEQACSIEKTRRAPHLVLRILFSFLCPVHPALPQAIFFPKILSFWDLGSTLSSREKAASRGWVLGTVLDGVAPQEKKENPFFWRVKKSEVLPMEAWQADLLVGFAADFGAWLVDFGGSCAGGFFVFGWRIFRWIFSAYFSFVFCDQKIQRQNPPLPWRFFWRVTTVGWNPDRPWANSKFSTGTLPEIEIRFVCPFFRRLRKSWLIGQEIAHSKARRQSEI